MILGQIDERSGSGEDDRRYHLVAPPGSGKTIVGLELIRRFGAPAVVFAPTTTIQRQWQEKVGMFTADPAVVTGLTSLDPARLGPITIFTYQLISTPGEAREAERELAQRRWVEELLLEGQAADGAAAGARIETLHRNNPRAHEREMARYYLRIKRELLAGSQADVASFLHPNAQRLVESLVAHRVGTVVLDECHHLLDYWAIVLRHLLGRLEQPRVVGLTATLPSPEDERAYENYTSLLGDVDFEVPTPAVVKEGDLAPYRDLVRFVRPSRREHDYLRHIQRSFEEGVTDVTGSERFVGWVTRLVVERPAASGGQVPWEAFLTEHPLLSLAGLRFLRQRGVVPPAALPVPREAEAPMELDDWIALLERYALDELKLSPDPEDHDRLRRLRRALLPFGLTLTERGLRQGRSPGDLVLALSESKDEAVVEILAAEQQDLGERLRAVVVTDFERMTAGVRRLEAVLERDAGSALRVFHRLVTDPRVAGLEPILVTGRTVLMDAAHGAGLIDAFNASLQEQGLRATCLSRETALPDVLEVVGEGPDWSSGSYVRMVTRAFEEGRVRCLVGTRGIFGEGWDALVLNTLVDLTSVTTSTSVQQLRGRTIRLDPAWPRKLAHNWDVICIETGFDRGDGDLRRFLRRHDRTWGLTPPATDEHLVSAAVRRTLGDPRAPAAGGQVVRGVAHVDDQLAFGLAVHGWKRFDYGAVNRRMLAEIGRRDRSYKLWRVGEEYRDVTGAACRVDPSDLRIRTVHTISETLTRMIRQFAASVAVGLGILLYLGFTGMIEALEAGAPIDSTVMVVALVLVVGLALVILLNARAAWRIARAVLREQPVDSILLDVGSAVVEALREAGLVSRGLRAENVVAEEQPDGSYRILLERATATDAERFVRAYREVFEPVRDQRYLILRDDGRLPLLSGLWRLLRLAFRSSERYEPAYHPVPDMLATRRERADAYARHWARFVGGGQLIHTRSEQGRKVLLEARAQRRPNVKGLAFETWR